MDKKLIKEYQNTALAIAKIERDMSLAVAAFQNNLTDLRDKEAAMKEQIKAAMEKNVVTKFENDVIKITYIAPQVRNSVDVTRLKEEEPETYNKFIKQTKVNSSIRIKVKEIQ